MFLTQANDVKLSDRHCENKEFLRKTLEMRVQLKLASDNDIH